MRARATAVDLVRRVGVLAAMLCAGFAFIVADSLQVQAQIPTPVPTRAVTQAAPRVALVIGNGAYPGGPGKPGLPFLANPTRDADLIASALRTAGFDVTIKKDLTRNQMNDEVAVFARKAQAADVAVIYFAGHGITNGTHDYLIPVDADLQTAGDVALVGTQSVDFETFKLAAQAKVLGFIVVDACRDNPVNGKSGLAIVDPEPNQVVAFSTSQGSVAEDGTGGNGPFAMALAKNLPTPGVDIRKMMGQVIDDVKIATSTRQIPVLNPGSLGARDTYLVQPLLIAQQPPQISNVVPGSQSDPRGPLGACPAGSICVTQDAKEYQFWDSIKNSTDPALFQAYLDQWPTGTYAPIARIKGGARVTPLAPAPMPPPVAERQIISDISPPPADQAPRIAPADRPPPGPTAVAAAPAPSPAPVKLAPPEGTLGTVPISDVDAIKAQQPPPTATAPPNPTLALNTPPPPPVVQPPPSPVVQQAPPPPPVVQQAPPPVVQQAPPPATVPPNQTLALNTPPPVQQPMTVAPPPPAIEPPTPPVAPPVTIPPAAPQNQQLASLTPPTPVQPPPVVQPPPPPAPPPPPPVVQPPAGSPVIPITMLPLHPDVANAIQKARDAEIQAREKAAAGRAAQAKAQAAAEKARADAQRAAAQTAPSDVVVQNFANLGSYQGGIANGQRQGAGLWIGVDGERYEGEWQGDNRNGVGITNPTSKIRFEGTWQNGKPCGVGVVTWPNGDHYEGDYCDGHYNGYGVFYFVTTSNTSYARENTGQWTNDKQTGFGIRLWAGGNRTEGQWLNGELSGYGAEFNTDGRISTKRDVMQQGVYERDMLKTPLAP